MAYVPLPAYNPGPGINFGPVNQAFDAIAQQNNANRQYGLQEKASERADQQFAVDKRNSDLQYQNAMVRQSAGIAQAAMNERDPAKKAALMSQIYSLHPEYRDRLVAAGVNPNDFDNTANFIVSEARGYLNPQDVALKDAQIAEARAGVTKSNAEVAAMRRQADFVRSLFPEMAGGSMGSMPSDGSPAIAPAASSYSFSGPANNALVAISGQPGNALMPRPSGVSNAPTPPPPRNAFAAPAQSYPSSALPDRKSGAWTRSNRTIAARGTINEPSGAGRPDGVYRRQRIGPRYAVADLGGHKARHGFRSRAEQRQGHVGHSKQ